VLLRCSCLVRPAFRAGRPLVLEKLSSFAHLIRMRETSNLNAQQLSGPGSLCATTCGASAEHIFLAQQGTWPLIAWSIEVEVLRASLLDARRMTIFQERRGRPGSEAGRRRHEQTQEHSHSRNGCATKAKQPGGRTQEKTEREGRALPYKWEGFRTGREVGGSGESSPVIRRRCG